MHMNIYIFFFLFLIEKTYGVNDVNLNSIYVFPKRLLKLLNVLEQAVTLFKLNKGSMNDEDNWFEKDGETCASVVNLVVDYHSRQTCPT